MYQKCVCFIFLVILAILSCSGFRIDSLAMTDFNKKNFHNSPNAYSNTDKYFRADTVHKSHKIRHHRLWRTQAHNRYPKPPHIDPIVFPPPQPTSSSSDSTSNERLPPRWPFKSSTESRESISEFQSTSSEVLTFSEVKIFPTLFPDENLAQIPPTEFAPARFVVSRSQRSPKRRRNRWSVQQSEDFFAKAYKAKYVVIAEVESKPRFINESNGPCQFYVKVIRDFKGNANMSFGIVNKVYRHMLTARCDLVKEMKNSKKYMMLLNDNLQLMDSPKPREKLKRRAMTRLKRVCKKGFVPTKPHVEIKEVSPISRRKIEKRNRILICRVKGFPLPRITWRRKNEVLHPSRAYNVLYQRNQSKLVIKKPDAEYLGQYECVAENLSGHTAIKNFTLLPPQPSESISSDISKYLHSFSVEAFDQSISSDQECPPDYKEAFCENGGTCLYIDAMEDYACSCPENYSGLKCEVKIPGNTRFLMDQVAPKRLEKNKKRNEWH